MIEALREPLRPRQAGLLMAGALVAVALYCLAYSALAGVAESPIEALLWAAANVLPWLAAFELGKRVQGMGRKVLVLGGALLASLLLGGGGDFGFELVRRLPGLAATAALLTLGASLVRRRAPTALPLLPGQLDWISAAGNYVELHAGGRVILHRAPLSQVEADLARHGFVRIHRSILVRRECIARVRPLDVVLHDGTILRTGNRYRAALRG